MNQNISVLKCSVLVLVGNGRGIDIRVLFWSCICPASPHIKWKNSPIFLRSLEQLSPNTLNCKSYQYIFKANKLNLPQDRICIGQANAARILPPLSSWDTCWHYLPINIPGWATRGGSCTQRPKTLYWSSFLGTWLACSYPCWPAEAN